MLGGVISFTIGYQLLLLIIYYWLSFTIGLIPLLHVLFFRLNIANIGKKAGKFSIEVQKFEGFQAL